MLDKVDVDGKEASLIIPVATMFGNTSFKAWPVRACKSNLLFEVAELADRCGVRSQ